MKARETRTNGENVREHTTEERGCCGGPAPVGTSACCSEDAAWEEEGGSVVSIARPEAMFELVNRPDVQPVAAEADQRLRRALEQIAPSA
jgi:hypothetical protein